MSNFLLRLYEDNVGSNSDLSLLAVDGYRVVYVVEGEVCIEVAGKTEVYRENTAWFGAHACVIRAKEESRVWRWELVRCATENDENLLASHDLPLDVGGKYLMRCDRVDFPPGGIAYTHTHPGSGIRCLLRGRIRINVEQKEKTYEPGQCWFESGPDPVLALGSETEATSFVRVMVLPRDYQGRSSIRYVRPEDARKPKLQEYTRFIDEFIEV
jgi:quercetin dioxygenase-like cupin family protein